MSVAGILGSCYKRVILADFFRQCIELFWDCWTGLERNDLHIGRLVDAKDERSYILDRSIEYGWLERLEIVSSLLCSCYMLEKRVPSMLR